LKVIILGDNGYDVLFMLVRGLYKINLLCVKKLWVRRGVCIFIDVSNVILCRICTWLGNSMACGFSVLLRDDCFKRSLRLVIDRGS